MTCLRWWWWHWIYLVNGQVLEERCCSTSSGFIKERNSEDDNLNWQGDEGWGKNWIKICVTNSSNPGRGQILSLRWCPFCLVILVTHRILFLFFFADWVNNFGRMMRRWWIGFGTGLLMKVDSLFILLGIILLLIRNDWPGCDLWCLIARNSFHYSFYYVIHSFSDSQKSPESSLLTPLYHRQVYPLCGHCPSMSLVQSCPTNRYRLTGK